MVTYFNTHRRYLNIRASIRDLKYWYKLQDLEKYLNTVVEALLPYNTADRCQRANGSGYYEIYYNSMNVY